VLVNTSDDSTANPTRATFYTVTVPESAWLTPPTTMLYLPGLVPTFTTAHHSYGRVSYTLPTAPYEAIVDIVPASDDTMGILYLPLARPAEAVVAALGFDVTAIYGLRQPTGDLVFQVSAHKTGHLRYHPPSSPALHLLC